MARERTDWSELDRYLRRMDRAGLSVKRQARRLNVCERSIYSRRQALGLGRKQAKQEVTSNA